MVLYVSFLPFNNSSSLQKIRDATRTLHATSIHLLRSCSHITENAKTKLNKLKFNLSHPRNPLVPPNRNIS
uniref:Uncharacterized protein n=1 Tax=Manihot esculenta TaxID=3983 RepID=A0A2C9VXW3_MANES